MEYRYQQIVQHFQKAIATGNLAIGAKLPSLRLVRLQFACALSVVQQAYAELQRTGLIQGVEKSVFFVLATCVGKLPRPETIPLARRPHIPQTNDLISRIMALAAKPRIVPLHGAIPSPMLLPLQSIRSHIRATLADDPGILGRYTPAAGSLALRNEILQLLLARGMHTHPDEIIISNGCSESLRLAIEACSALGDTIAIETPAFFGMISLLELMGRKALGIPTRADTGLDLDALERILVGESIKACMVTPNFQNPLGALMPNENKARLSELAVRHGFMIIEDDIYGECYAHGPPPRPLRALVPEAPVIYCSSFSKTVAPGLRLGFCIPGSRHTKMRLSKQRSTLGGPAFVQEAFARFLSLGGYTRHMAPFRHSMTSQVLTMRHYIQEFFPVGTRVSHPHGGYFLWVELSKGMQSMALFEQALQQGIGIIPGPAFSLRGAHYTNSLRLSCANPVDEHTIQALQNLGEILENS